MSNPQDAAEFDSQASRDPHLYQIHGTHRLKVIEIREGVSKNPKTRGQPMYTIACEVVASDNQQLRAGDRVAVVQVRSPNDTTGKYWIKIKAIIAACLVRKEREVTHAGYTWAVAPAQPLANKLFDARVGDGRESFSPATGDPPRPSSAPYPREATMKTPAPHESERVPGSDDGVPPF